MHRSHWLLHQPQGRYFQAECVGIQTHPISSLNGLQPLHWNQPQGRYFQAECVGIDAQRRQLECVVDKCQVGLLSRAAMHLLPFSLHSLYRFRPRPGRPGEKGPSRPSIPEIMLRRGGLALAMPSGR